MMPMQIETIKKVIQAEKMAKDKKEEAEKTAHDLKQDIKKNKQKELLAMEERLTQYKKELQEQSKIDSKQKIQLILDQAEKQCNEIETLARKRKDEAIAIVLKKVVE